jgi:hypothetical protein
MNLLQAISAASLLVLVPSGVSSAGEMLRLRHNGGALVIAAMPGEHGRVRAKCRSKCRAERWVAVPVVP